MPTPRSVAVIGGGLLGASSAYALARRGDAVTLFDAGDLPDERASSHDRSKVIRAAYGAVTSRYAPLVRRAWRAWGEIETAAGVSLRHASGVVLQVDSWAPDAFANTTLAAFHDVRHEVWSLDDARRRLPALRWDGMVGALWEPDAGWIAALPAVRALAALAAGHSATLRPRTPVARFEERPDGVWVDGTRFDAAVVAAGAWIGRLCPSVPATVTQQHAALFRPSNPAAFAGLPVWLHDLSDEGWYGFPIGADGVLKLGRHRRGRPVDPDADRTPDPGFEDDARAFVAAHLPAMRPDDPLVGWACRYTSSTTGDLVVDRLPDHDRVVVCGLGSGHAFKFGPVLGELAADALDGVPPTLPWPEAGGADVF